MSAGPDPERVVVINDASVARGGATGLALLSARLLRSRGLPVTLICGDEGAWPEAAALGIEVIALGQRRLLQADRGRALTQGLWNRAAQDLVAQVVARHDTPRTVYHVHGWAQILSPAVFAALRPAAPRVLTHAHDMFLACPNGVYTDFPRGAVCTRVPLGAACLATQCDKRSYAHKGWRVARQALLRRAFDARLDWGPVAMIHPAMREPLERGGLPPRRLTVLRNPAQPWTAARIPAEANRGVVFVGRLERDKGAEALAEAAAAAGVPLTMVGDGPLRAPLAERFPQIAFAGWRARDEIGAFAARARALVMPSLIPEPFGLVAAEAALSGLPVILPDSAMMAAEIAAAGLGLVYPAAGHGALRAALERLQQLPDAEVRGMSLRAHGGSPPLAEAPEVWATGMLALYRGMLARVPAPPEAAVVR